MQYTELFRICNVQRYLEYKQNMHESAEYAKQLEYAEPNLPNQTYQTKPTKLNLPNQTYLTKPNLQNWLKQSTPGSVVPLAMFICVLCQEYDCILKGNFLYLKKKLSQNSFRTFSFRMQAWQNISLQEFVGFEILSRYFLFIFSQPFPVK